MDMRKKLKSHKIYISTYDRNFFFLNMQTKKILGTFIQLDIFHNIK